MAIPFGYAGQYTDAETGLQILQARYYDPATAQFISVDPLVHLTGQPYAYTADNPLNATDPTGKDCSLWTLVTGGCRLPTWQEAQATWTNEVKPALYGSAVQITGFCDAVAFGQCSTLAGLAGAHVPDCSSDYQFGNQVVGGVYNVALMAGTLGLDGAADAAVADGVARTAETTTEAAQTEAQLSQSADGELGATLRSGSIDSGPGVNSDMSYVVSSDSGAGIPQYVYRGGSASPTNLTPRPGIDTTGLSTFDTLEAAVEPGGKAQVIDTTKLTTLRAVPDAPPPGHVSIAPSDPQLIPGWAATRGKDVVHPLTQEIMNAVVDTVRRPR